MCSSTLVALLSSSSTGHKRSSTLEDHPYSLKNKLRSLLVVMLSLHSKFPHALALFVSCYLIPWPLSCPIQPAVCCTGGVRKVLPILLLYSQVSGGISAAFTIKSCQTCHRAVSPSMTPRCSLHILL